MPATSERYHDAEWLREQYHGHGKTQQEIADECGVSPRAIRAWMKKHGIDTRDVRGEHHGLYDEERDEDVKERISQTMEGREMDEQWRQRIAESHTGTPIPNEVREQIADSLDGTSRSEDTRQKMSEARKGEKNPMYVAGESGYYGPEWSLARRQAKKRDEVCQTCGADATEGRLEVHHIVRFNRVRQAEDADLSEGHDLSNLVLLCQSCHMRAEHEDLSFESEMEDPLDD